MSLRVVGAGLPRTGTTSLMTALEHLLGGECYHMHKIPDHPFDLGAEWDTAIAGGTPDWDKVFEGYNAGVDWPTSMFWRELSEKYPDSVIVLSVRETPETWLKSLEATILPVAREALAPDWSGGRGLLDLFERFTGTTQWDDPAMLLAAYDRHNADVRQTAPADRLVEWQPSDGWTPPCRALNIPVPEMDFPWKNRHSEWWG